MSGSRVETLVNGEWVGAEEWLDVTDPATNTVVAQVPSLTSSQVTSAFDAAVKAFEGWRRTSAFERAAILRRAAGLIRQRATEIAAEIIAENGKTLAEATGEAGKAADFLDYYAALDRAPFGELLHDVRPGTQTSVRREPIGVVTAITPWNDPLLTPARKLAPALMSGNTAVLKPATETPRSGLHLARALHDAGLPAGVLNVVTGRGSVIGDALLDERISALTFTGSNEVGEALRAQVADRNIRFQAELGGKNATVVLADADLAAAVEGVVAAGFGQAGERCTATSRVILDRDIHDDFVALLTARLAAIRPGRPDAEGTTMGPLVSASHQGTVLAAIETARAQGATVLVGGGVPDGDLARGCFVEPTLIGDVTETMDLWREEVFGPVVAVRAVAGLTEAIEAVNDSDFGLAAAIFTQSLSSAHRFVEEVDTGQVAVNTTTSGWDVHHPFGGFRGSGSAFKEQGTEALHFYTKVKTVAIKVSA
ncbi:MAG: aldehyde dehydrogenase family protein [Actinomycetota bacterium]|nr:aldehyde dehydrogenase family protein [Actinomycetota bacterium]